MLLPEWGFLSKIRCVCLRTTWVRVNRWLKWMLERKLLAWGWSKVSQCVCMGGEFPEEKSKEDQILTIALFLYESQRSVLYKSHSLLLNTALFAYDMRTFFTLQFLLNTAWFLDSGVDNAQIGKMWFFWSLAANSAVGWLVEITTDFTWFSVLQLQSRKKKTHSPNLKTYF